MQAKRFGKTGRAVTEIGMGTYYDKPWIRIAKHGVSLGASTKVKAIAAGLDHGITLIDSAEAYFSEPFIARAMRGRRRDEVFIATKVWLDHLHHDDLVAALDRSLRRLETPYVDLYQIHFPNPAVPIRETMGAMEEMVEKGKARAIGVSNFSLEQMKEASSALSRVEIAAAQINYSLVHRKVEKDIIPYCRENGIAVLAYYPLGHGLLAARDARLDAVCARNSKSPAQVALNWLTSRPEVFAIPRASRPSHVIEDAGASGWRLSEADIQELDRAFPVTPPPT
ncbi:MAG: aldo/keto reductase [Nitrososphaerota archaeon]|nr:aldo/keto reductase [Nitrososphaerota archaeon]MDG6979162.1 aldo/keto reductase [Nitrososphaerota archaeon]